MEIRSLLDSLKEEILRKHAFIHHPFFKLLYEGKLTVDQVRGWAKQFWVIPKVHLVNNAGKLTHAQLINGSPLEQLLESPYDSEITARLGDAVMDELGRTSLSPMNHYDCYFDLTDELGIPREEVGKADGLLPTTLITMYAWTMSAKDFPLVELIGSHNFVNDVANIHAFPRLCEALIQHYHLSKKAVAWFDLHGEVDKEHGAMGEFILSRYLKNETQLRRARYAVTFGLGIFWTLHDGVMDAYVNRTYPM